MLLLLPGLFGVYELYCSPPPGDPDVLGSWCIVGCLSCSEVFVLSSSACFSDVTSHLINNKMTQLHVSLKNGSSGNNLMAALKRKAALFHRQGNYSHLTWDQEQPQLSDKLTCFIGRRLSSYSLCCAVPVYTWTHVITKGDMQRLKHISHLERDDVF